MTDFDDFTHYREKEFDDSETFSQSNTNNKPNGIWLAKGNEWFNWNRSNLFKIYTHKYGVESIDKDKIVRIETLKDIEDFLKKYIITNIFDRKCINWSKVAEDYAGIYINYKALYTSSFNFKYEPFDMLIQSLDVDSLVVWDLNILSLKLLNYQSTGILKSDLSDDDSDDLDESDE
jgi:hypothetical protein